MLLVLTGLRKTEAMTLRWVDIDFHECTLTVRAEKTKNAREHKLPLSGFLLTMLARRAANNRQSEYVFPGRIAEHLSSVQNSINEISRQIDYRFSLHDLRRGFITAAAKTGVPHHLIRKLVNHAGDDVTAGYMLFAVDDLRQPMEVVNTHLLKLMQSQG